MSENRTFLLLVLVIFSFAARCCCSSSSEKSCDSKCSHGGAFPRCGVWVNWDNSRMSSGAYLLGEGLANLTCVVTSLPRPSTVRWYFQPAESSKVTGGAVVEDANEYFSADREPLPCSSLRTTTECKYNEFGEHRITSVCLVKIRWLNQTGSYVCTAKLLGDNDDDDNVGAAGAAGDELLQHQSLLAANVIKQQQNDRVESAKIRLNVYGISNLSVLGGHKNDGNDNDNDNDNEDEEDDFAILEYGTIGQIRVRVCANPKPYLIWIHRPSGRSIAAGSSSQNETASHLHHELSLRGTTMKNRQLTSSTSAVLLSSGPIGKRHYCYTASLIIGRVGGNETDVASWTIMTWNNVDTRRFDVPIKLIGLPQLPSKAASISMIDKISTIFLIFVIIGGIQLGRFR